MRQKTTPLFQTRRQPNHSHNPSNTDPTLVSFVWCLSPLSPKKPTRRVCHPCCGRHIQRTCKWTPSAAAATSQSTRCDASSWSNISKMAVEPCPPPFPALGAEKVSRIGQDQTDRKTSKIPRNFLPCSRRQNHAARFSEQN